MLGTPSSSASSLIFFSATILPLAPGVRSFALYTTPYVPVCHTPPSAVVLSKRPRTQQPTLSDLFDLLIVLHRNAGMTGEGDGLKVTPTPLLRRCCPYAAHTFYVQRTVHLDFWRCEAGMHGEAAFNRLVCRRATPP